MNTKRIGGKITYGGGDPYRGWAQSEDMKIHFELDEDELEEAIVEWLINNHGQKIEGETQVLCTFDNSPGDSDRNRTVKKNFFDKYQITLEVEA